MGGALEAIKKGFIQTEIMRSAYNYQKAVDSGEQVVVGVNMFATEDKPTLKLLEIDEEIEKKQLKRLSKLKRERDNKRVSQVLDKVRQVAEGDQNIMPVLIEAVKAYATVGEITDALREAVKAYATVGEITDALRDVFGEYREPTIV